LRALKAGAPAERYIISPSILSHSLLKAPPDSLPHLGGRLTQEIASTQLLSISACCA